MKDSPSFAIMSILTGLIVCCAVMVALLVQLHRLDVRVQEQGGEIYELQRQVSDLRGASGTAPETAAPEVADR